MGELFDGDRSHHRQLGIGRWPTYRNRCARSALIYGQCPWCRSLPPIPQCPICMGLYGLGKTPEGVREEWVAKWFAWLDEHRTNGKELRVHRIP